LFHKVIREGLREQSRPVPAIVQRLLSARAAAMLARNTVVGTSVFAIDLLILWGLVSKCGMPKLTAGAIGFLVSTSLHYVAGRSWIFRGTTRPAVSRYFYFVTTAGAGLVMTLLMFAALIEWTNINYLIARIIVSLFAGLAMFLLNAVFNFRSV
jgi:putative flippase GtrA